MTAGVSWEIKAIHHSLVLCSMFLSAYFGWTISESVFPLNLILALMCAMVAFGVSTMFRRAAEYDTSGYRLAAIRCWIIGAMFLAANMIFDYSSAAALREQVAVSASNQNKAADNAESRVTLLDKAIDKIEKDAAWTTDLRAPKAYQADIDRLEGDRIFARSKQCGDVSLPDSRKLCEDRASAIANQAMAQRRLGLLEEMKQLRTERDGLLKDTKETQHAANPALAQIKMLGSWFTWTRTPSDLQAFWVQNSVMLIMSILVNTGLAYLGHEMGSSAPRVEPPPPSSVPHHPFSHALTDQRPPDARRYDPVPPIPLQPVPSGGTANITVIGDASGTTMTRDEFNRLMSPFWENVENLKKKRAQS